MTEETVEITKGFALELQELVRDWRKRPPGRPHAPKGSPTFEGGTIVVALLESIVSGGSGLAAVLRPKRTNERQILDLRGEIYDSTRWVIRYFPDPSGNPSSFETTAELRGDASPADVRSALEALEAFNPGDVRVQLGTHSRRRPQTTDQTASHTVYRWIVEFTGQFTGTDVSLLEPIVTDGSGDESIQNLAFTTSQTTIIEDTGETVRVHGVIPVGHPTPLVKGAVGVASWVHGFGWVLHAVECRRLSDSFVQEAIY